MFEWAGMNLKSVFAQAKNLYCMQMWRMRFDVVGLNYFDSGSLGEDCRLWGGEIWFRDTVTTICIYYGSLADEFG